MKNNGLIKSLCLLVFLFIAPGLFAHTIVEETRSLSGSETAWLYLRQGFLHIIPLGLDHILFISSLVLVHKKLKPVLWQSLAFTAAHSITLALAVTGSVNIPGRVVEPLIALSIVYIALENIVTRKQKKSRLVVVFLFGLLHGLGFAGALSELGLPQTNFIPSLVLFNIEVELGQLAVIFITWFFITRWFSNKIYYRKFILSPASLSIAAIATFWLIQRVT